jgi:hypothetical protein
VTWENINMSPNSIRLALLFVALIGTHRFRSSRRRTAAGPTALGMNLNGPADWNSELPFVDVFRLSRSWTQKQALVGPRLALDEHGWVTRLEPSCCRTPLCALNWTYQRAAHGVRR